MNGVKRFFGLVIAVILAAVPARAQFYEWARAVGGDGRDRALSTTSDDDGRIYVAGRFEG
jgi:hypothetical protein